MASIRRFVNGLAFFLSQLTWHAFWADLSFNQQHPTVEHLVSSFFGVPGRNATYAYVIAGGGTAGLALAVRLAEANLSVAVVEAGGFYETDNSNYSVVPGYATFYSGLIRTTSSLGSIGASQRRCKW